ncbi:MAG: acetyl-CoA carboxylase biotin carboxyl carrier protein [Flavobacteriales bacterium]|jgi:acetyl-CoA carboxylase biotin carboxyl carrier protein
MKLADIQDLIKFVSKSGVSEVEIEQKDFKISIKSGAPKKGKNEPETVYIQQPQQMQQLAAPQAAPVAAAPAVPVAEVEEVSNLIEIKAQMIGTFYRKSSPDTPAFVEVGDTIKAGDEICIIEAMKLYNKIESEVSGKIVKVLVDDSTPVEFDQVLFLVDPS